MAVFLKIRHRIITGLVISLPSIYAWQNKTITFVASQKLQHEHNSKFKVIKNENNSDTQQQMNKHLGMHRGSEILFIYRRMSL